MSQFDEKIYGKMTFGDLMKEIHSRTKEKDRLTMDLIEQLKPMIVNIQDALTLVPLIAQYMKMNLETNDQLIKMSAIVQKALQRTGTDDGAGSLLITDAEKEDLKRLAEEYSKNTNQLGE